MNSARTYESGSSPLKSDKSPRITTPRAEPNGSPTKSQRFHEANKEQSKASLKKRRTTQEPDSKRSGVKNGHQSIALNENNNNDSYISSVGDSFESNNNIGSQRSQSLKSDEHKGEKPIM